MFPVIANDGVQSLLIAFKVNLLRGVSFKEKYE